MHLQRPWKERNRASGNRCSAGARSNTNDGDFGSGISDFGISNQASTSISWRAGGTNSLRIGARPLVVASVSKLRFSGDFFVRQISFRMRSATAMLLAITLAGCVAKVAPAPAPPTAKTTATASATAGPEIKLYRIDKVGYDASFDFYPGKVVLVDFWATWCPKCREDFPHTVELDRKYASEGLVVVSFSCDD